jgi:amino acid transporter
MAETEEEPKDTISPPEEPGERSFVRLPRQRDGESPLAAQPELHERVSGRKPGSKFLRLTRSGEQKLRRVGEGEYEVTRVGSEPTKGMGRFVANVRHAIIGQTLASSQLSHQRLSKFKALAIFSSDALSSSAYATEEILLVLILAGASVTAKAIPISLAIAALAAIVVVSYRQTIKAYPNGGGAYIVANENLGAPAALVAGSALLVDYIMTVAVSTAAGVAAIVSAAPSMHNARVELALLFVLLITLGNLRGIRESGTIFAIPTYIFIVGFGGMLAVGFIKLIVNGHIDAVPVQNPVQGGTQALTLFLLLRAFSSGSAALTGIEAVANGVPSFKPPEWKNAATTQMWMAIILVLFFVGTTVLAHEIGVLPSESKTVVAQIAESVLGHNVLFFIVQASTVMILILAANTAFAGLPTLASVMAKDSVMPKQFAFRGDRLAFSNGIILLGLASSAVLVVFGAQTHKIIPLYAFGVFTAFTLSQAGMVIHWRRHREEGWRRALAINAVGAIATAIVAVIVGATKFTRGAWLSIAIMLLLVLVLWKIKSHYEQASHELGRGLAAAEGVAEHFYVASAGRPQTVIVPVEEIDRAVLRTIAYARTLSSNAIAIHVTDDREQAEALRLKWDEAIPDMPLVIVESPYRSLVEPIVAYIEGLDRTQPNQMVTVVLAEFIPKHFWQRFLHNQLALRLKKALSNRQNTVLVDVPYHLTH